MTDQTVSERSSSELEREAERVRADIADTAEHLKDKMSPGQLMDEVVDYFKDGDANQLLSNLKTQVRDNPLALALVGGGLAWLMMGSGSSSHHSPATGRTPPARSMHAPSNAASADTTSTMRSGSHASSSESTVAKGAEAIRDRGASVAASIGEAATSATDTMSAKAHDLRDAVGDYVSSASHAGTEAGSHLKSSFLDALEREPLVLGALGVAVGAAIGAMLPPTRAEQEYLGEASRKARDSAEAAIADGVDKAKHVASDVYNAARSEADRQGLVPGDRPFADKIGDVARSAGDELKNATDESLQQARETADRTTDRLSGRDKPT